MLMELALAVVAVLAGAIAALTGFGIGSLLTPLLALETGTRIAVAVIAIPHFAGSALRFWILRREVDRQVLLRFGVTSAAGGLAGALLHTQAESRALAIVFGVLVGMAGVSELTGWIERVRWGKRSAWTAGFLSGGFGGLVGNQGGIRSAAMLGFNVPRDSFVATATAIALAVDVARLPVYAVAEGGDIVDHWRFVAIATAGVVAGTVAGSAMLHRLPQRLFRRVLAFCLVLLGAYMIAAG
jgi:uncharacterized membrane protein YfcA